MLQSDAASTITNLINWFSVFDFTKNIKQAGDEIFKCASLCKTLSLYGIILQSYCTNKKGAIFYASQCTLISDCFSCLTSLKTDHLLYWNLIFFKLWNESEIRNIQEFTQSREVTKILEQYMPKRMCFLNLTVEGGPVLVNLAEIFLTCEVSVKVAFAKRQTRVTIIIIS